MPRASPHRRKPAHLLLTLRARCISRPEFSHGRSEASGRLGRIGTVRGHETSEDFASVRLEEIDLTDPGPGEVQVRVMACAVNFPDLTMVQGKRQHRGVAARPRRRRNGGGGTRQALRRQGHRHGTAAMRSEAAQALAGALVRQWREEVVATAEEVDHHCRGSVLLGPRSKSVVIVRSCWRSGTTPVSTTRWRTSPASPAPRRQRRSEAEPLPAP